MDQYRAQRSNTKLAVAGARRIWAGLGDDFSEQWESRARGSLLELVEGARGRAVDLALPYTSDLLTDTGQRAPAVGSLVADRFLAAAPDGQQLVGLLDQAPIVVRTQLAGGASVSSALDVGGRWLAGAVLTTLADTRRSVYEADNTSRPQLTGYVRMLNPPSCSRCAILAGKWFRWNEGFKRHPRCDCQHIPASENVGGDLRTDPYEYFKSLDPADQARLFGRENARAIRDGADIYRVVNVRMRGLATPRMARKYGTPHRLTIEDIYSTTSTRDEAIRLMEREGFITGPQRAGGNIVGPYREQFSAPISRPVRPGSARERVLTARRTGVRDPLDRATMTAQERRTFDAFYRLQHARKHGVLPRTVGMNSADVYAGSRGLAATPERLARLERELQAQLSLIRPNQASMHRLVDALGLRDSEAASSSIFDKVESRMRQQFASATGATRVRRPTTASGSGAGGTPPRGRGPAAAAPGDDADDLARRIRAAAETVEPAITDQLSTMASRHGATMVGLEFRLKGTDSIARKIRQDALTDGIPAAAAAEQLGDVIRYTMLATPATYASTVRSVLAELERQGWKIRMKNFWRTPLNGYRGVNVPMISPAGQRTELQFHTSDSHRVKETVLHPLYEQRRTSTDRAEREHLAEQMRREGAKIPTPPGAEAL